MGKEITTNRYIMKNLGCLITMSFLLAACGVDQSKYNEMAKNNESLQSKVDEQNRQITELRDSVKRLSYPAKDRLAKAKELIQNGNLTQSRQEANELAKLFPNCEEAKSVPAILDAITQKENEIAAEKKRIESLGFKALKPVTSVKIGYNTVSFTTPTTSGTYTHDSHGDEYYYNTADRGNQFVCTTMKVTSTDNDPELPQLAVYSINGGKMTLVTRFRTCFARWKDYGTYLGNYHDNGNDFAKVSTVSFKLGAEVSNTILNKPYAVVLKKENGLVRHTERFDNPPVSYIGEVDYKNTLTIPDFQNNYVVLKIANLK